MKKVSEANSQNLGKAKGLAAAKEIELMSRNEVKKMGLERMGEQDTSLEVKMM